MSSSSLQIRGWLHPKCPISVLLGVIQGDGNGDTQATINGVFLGRSNCLGVITILTGGTKQIHCIGWSCMRRRTAEVHKALPFYSHVSHSGGVTIWSKRKSSLFFTSGRTHCTSEWTNLMWWLTSDPNSSTQIGSKWQYQVIFFRESLKELDLEHSWETLLFPHDSFISFDHPLDMSQLMPVIFDLMGWHDYELQKTRLFATWCCSQHVPLDY